MKTLISKQVKMLFKRLKDLAVDVVFEDVTTTGFNFITQEATVKASPVKTIKGIVLEKEVKDSKLVAKILFDINDLPNPDVYDKATINGEVWKFNPPHLADNFTVTVNATKVQ